MPLLRRILRHMFSHIAGDKRVFTPVLLQSIERAIAQSESLHAGQIRFVLETDLDFVHILRGKTPRQRALELFSQLGIWDTEHNNGVLIYLLLADHDVEIVADRGIHQHVGQAGWEKICQQMEQHFRQRQFEQGLLLGIDLIGQHMQQHFPVTHTPQNELSNAPVLL